MPSNDLEGPRFTDDTGEMSIPHELQDRLQTAGQDHLLAFAHELPADEQSRFVETLERVDLNLLARLFTQGTGAGSPHEGESRAALAGPPSDVIRQPATPEDEDEWEQATDLGHTLLGAGQVGAILVAGGQGTRLGFDKPKGMFPIGPVSGATLFQILAEQILARGHEVGRPIPYYVMTSDATHDETVAFFKEQKYFGFDPADLFFFRQGNMPALDADSGKILLAGKGRLALSPDGHGGILAALKQSGALDDMARRGLEALHYHQVDNPTAIVCDPAFLGWHVSRVSELSTKVVAKSSPAERMGVLCDVEGSTEIIEYSDLPAELADKRDPNGNPVFWAGNTAMHVLSRSFLERLCDGRHDLPFHIARKAVPHLNARGELVHPAAPNAFKFERFIFDALPEAKRALVLEADRSREFNPVKNAEGTDSPATAQAAIDRICKSWLQRAGVELPEDATVEISPLFALDEQQLRRKIDEGTRLQGNIYLRP